MDRSWFEDKSILDIGCNAGNVLLWISAYWNPTKAIGVDIDGSLIGKARKNLRRIAKSNVFTTIPNKDKQNNEIGKEEKERLGVQNTFCEKFPNNVEFKTCDIVLEESFSNSVKFDCILLLSVCKWIHLNYGDDGLLNTFKKCFNMLNENGKLIIEPQTWESYKKKKRVTSRTKENYKNIKMKPDTFVDILLNDVGFSQVDTLSIQYPKKSSGFSQRSIYVLTK